MRITKITAVLGVSVSLLAGVVLADNEAIKYSQPEVRFTGGTPGGTGPQALIRFAGGTPGGTGPQSPARFAGGTPGGTGPQMLTA